MRTILSATNILCTLVFIVCSLAVSAQSYSDTELKQNIQPISDPVKRLSLLEPKVFEYNTGKFKHLNLPSGVQYGLIAEDANKVVPGIVSYSNVSYIRGKNLYKTAHIPSVNMEQLVPLLIASIKEQQQAIEQLRSEIADLKNQVRTN